MIYQMPCPGKEGVFVASSYEAQEQAECELQGWAAGNGYRFAASKRTFTVYGASSSLASGCCWSALPAHANNPCSGLSD